MELEKLNPKTGEWEEVHLDDKDQDKDEIIEVMDMLQAELEIREVMDSMERNDELSL